jgi:hypothetical protein
MIAAGPACEPAPRGLPEWPAAVAQGPDMGRGPGLSRCRVHVPCRHGSLPRTRTKRIRDELWVQLDALPLDGDDVQTQASASA